MKTTQYSIKEMLFAILLFYGVILAIAVLSSSMAQSKENVDYPKNDKDVTQGALDLAGIVFPIDQVKQDGKYVDMVITKNARGLQEASTAYEISAMKKVTAKSPSTCPLINSTAIDKDVRNYNPFTGRATMKITFITEDMATKVSKADCLLIFDTETEPYSE